MKTKRLKKLLMGMGLSRNQANYMVKDQRTTGSPRVSNAIYYYYAKRYILCYGWKGNNIQPMNKDVQTEMLDRLKGTEVRI